ncbi:MAG: ATP-binding protein [Acidimicrobiia bacterium]
MKLPRDSIVERLVSIAPEAFGIGQPAVEASADPRGPVIVQLTVASAGVVIHAGMFFYTGLMGFLWVAILAAIYIVAVIPLSMRVAELDTSLATWVDLVAMTVMALIMGDPTTLLAWFPLIVFANLIYVPTVAAVKQLAAMIPLVFVFFVGMSGFSDRLFDAGVLRVYLGATLFMWLLSSLVYALSVGGSVSRRDSAVEEAIAERDEAEHRVRTEASRLRAVFEEAPIGLMLQKVDGAIEYANGPALEMMGLSLSELRSEGAVAAMAPATRTAVESEIVAAREAGKPFQIEHQTVAGRVIELRGRHIHQDGGYTTVTTLRDLTPQRDAHRHIARLRTLVENSETHMIVWDSNGEIVIGNRAFREMWNVGESAVGRPIVDIVGEQARPFLDMGRVSSERTYEREVATPQGPFLASISVLDLQDPIDGSWLRSMSVRDLTEVARARRGLEELVASKDQFIASVSHELRTPLTVVVGLASEMATDPARLLPEEIVEFSSLIAGQAAEVAALVEDLLTMARAEAGVLSISPEPMDLVTAARDVLAGLPAEVRQRVTWRGDDIGAVEVIADPVRVRQIIRNLLTNAGRHGGPTIEMELAAGTVFVKDDGPAVPEQERERMFQAYERVHHHPGRPDSVGLGLTVCRRLSRLMDGDVTYTHDGSRSVFALTLPKA